MKDYLEQYYEAAGFADFYERVLKGMSDDDVNELPRSRAAGYLKGRSMRKFVTQQSCGELDPERLKCIWTHLENKKI